MLFIYESYGTFPEGYYFYMSHFIGAVLPIISSWFTLDFLSGYQRIYRLNIKNIFMLLSKNITDIYVAQWILILTSVILVKYWFNSIVFNDMSVLIIVVFIVIASTISALAFKRIKK